jgi:hypothetical protein
VYVLRQNCRAAGWRWDTKNKVKLPKVCFTIECHLCHIDDQSILAALVQAILRNWTQFGTVDRRPYSGWPRISSGEQDEAVINVVRDSPLTVAVEAVGVINFPGSVRTARGRIKTSDLRNHVAARKIKLTPLHREARVGFALLHLAREDAFWRRIIFSDEKTFQSCPNGPLSSKIC